MVWIPLGLTIAWVTWLVTVLGRMLHDGISPLSVFERAQTEPCQVIHRPWLFFPYVALLGLWGWQLVRSSKEREHNAKTWELAAFFATLGAIFLETLRCW